MQRIGAFLKARYFVVSHLCLPARSSHLFGFFISVPPSAHQGKPASKKAPAIKKLPEGSLILSWCPRRDLNSHVFRQRFLRPPRLPFRHSGAKSNYTRCSRKRKPKFQSTRKKQRYGPKIVRTGTKAETRRLRSEDAEAKRPFGSKTSKKIPFGSWGPMRRTIRGEPNRPELASLQF